MKKRDERFKRSTKRKIRKRMKGNIDIRIRITYAEGGGEVRKRRIIKEE